LILIGSGSDVIVE